MSWVSHKHIVGFLVQQLVYIRNKKHIPGVDILIVVALHVFADSFMMQDIEKSIVGCKALGLMRI